MTKDPKNNYNNKEEYQCDDYADEKMPSSNCECYPQVKRCKAQICSSKTLTECPGQDINPSGKYGPLVAKIPVVIAEKIIQIDIESVIKLEEPAIEIKRIKKNIFLTQCKLLPRSGMTCDGKIKSGKLFLKGYIRKNIEYATAKCHRDDKIVSGDIRHTTVNIPFECITLIKYAVPPVFCTRETQSELEIFDPCVLGKDMREQDFVDFECFTERPYCELEDVKIVEVDIEKDIDGHDMDCCCCEDKFEAFQTITEKMVVYLRLKVLQNQQVVIPGKKWESCEPSMDDYELPKESYRTSEDF